MKDWAVGSDELCMALPATSRRGMSLFARIGQRDGEREREGVVGKYPRSALLFPRPSTPASRQEEKVDLPGTLSVVVVLIFEGCLIWRRKIGER